MPDTRICKYKSYERTVGIGVAFQIFLRFSIAVAFTIALELDMLTTQNLLSRAEFAFSSSNRFDFIVAYFINHKIYDIFKINAVLFRYVEQTLGE